MEIELFYCTIRDLEGLRDVHRHIALGHIVTAYVVMAYWAIRDLEGLRDVCAQAPEYRKGDTGLDLWVSPLI